MNPCILSSFNEAGMFWKQKEDQSLSHGRILKTEIKMNMRIRKGLKEEDQNTSIQ